MTADVYLTSDPIGRCPACGAETRAVKRSMYDDDRMIFTAELKVPTRCAGCGWPLQSDNGETRWGWRNRMEKKTEDGPVFVVKLNGMYKDVDLERHAERFKSELPGRVVVVDGRVDDIYKMTEQDVSKLVRVLEGR